MSKLTDCKRMTVYAIGARYNLVENTIEIFHAKNGNSSEEGCKNEPGKCGCVHAEINLLKNMPNPDNVIVTHSPCLDCAKALAYAGVKSVQYFKEYRLKDGIDFLKEYGVDVTRIVTNN